MDCLESWLLGKPAIRKEPGLWGVGGEGMSCACVSYTSRSLRPGCHGQTRHGRNREAYLSTRAAITKYCRLGVFNNRHLFLTVLEAGSSRLRCQLICFLVRTLMAYRWLPSLCVFTWLFLCAGAEREKSLVSLPLLIRTSVLLDSGTTLMTSFNPNYFLRGPIYK